MINDAIKTIEFVVLCIPAILLTLWGAMAAVDRALKRIGG